MLKEAAGPARYREDMKYGPIELLLIGLGAVVLTLIALWVREELNDWRATRHQREEERRHRLRGRREGG